MRIRAVTDEDRPWVAELLTEQWGSTTMVTRGVALAADQLPAFVAEIDDVRAGLLTYHHTGDEVELITINALRPGVGVGRALLDALAEETRRLGATRVWLVTSNDNIDALRFYQRAGYRITAVYPGAIDRAREVKPSIPLVGAHDIELHDEIELARTVAG
ncbi:GNAT family N-acetyltransferase [Actinophytocola sediminis]